MDIETVVDGGRSVFTLKWEVHAVNSALKVVLVVFELLHRFDNV